MPAGAPPAPAADDRGRVLRTGRRRCVAVLEAWIAATVLGRSRLALSSCSCNGRASACHARELGYSSRFSFDHQLEVRDHRSRDELPALASAASASAAILASRSAISASRSANGPRRSAEHRRKSRRIGRQLQRFRRVRRRGHLRMESQKRRRSQSKFQRANSIIRSRSAPRLLRVPPVDPGQQIPHLRRRDRHDPSAV